MCWQWIRPNCNLEGGGKGIEPAVGQALLLGEGKVLIELAVGQARLLGEGKVLIEQSVCESVQ